ncbi:MAG: 6-phospho-beta-glucosidase, partial [Eubacterium sp.]|nr:6-phospho-beta-glucosidase [Eubacterium sp.]
TNPAGVVSQTLRDMGYDFTYGICDAPSGMLRSFALLYNENPDNIFGEVYGLNHLSYFKSIKLNGKEIMDELIENDEAYAKTDMRYFSKELLRDRKAVLNEYLYYFYYREQAVENILKADKTRGEQIRDINKQMTAELSAMDIENDFEGCLKVFEKWYGMREGSYMASETGVKRTTPWHFDIYEEDDGGYAGVALKFIETAQSGTKGTMIMCIPNNGSINGLRDDDVVEITCDVDANGCVPHKIGDVDEQNLEMIRRVKIYERLSSKAIREKNKAAAVQALTLHPLVNSYSLAKELVEEYIEHNKDYSDGWK